VTDVNVVLSEVEQLRQRVRSRAHGGAWVPALAIGSFVACSILLYSQPFVGWGYVKYVQFPYWAGLPDEQRSPILSYLFWYLGLPALVGLIGWWYGWRSRKLGLRVAWKWFAIVAIGSLVLLGLLSALPTSAIPVGATSAIELDRNFDWVTGFATPLIAVALGVIMLGWVERSGWLIFAGLWIGWLTWWQSAYLTYGGLGGLPEWAGGPGVVTLLGVDTPGWLLVWMVLPLMAFGVIRGLRAARR
jgi:hypothetical protein